MSEPESEPQPDLEPDPVRSFTDALADGEYEYVHIEVLKEHPANEQIYGETDPDETFVKDIERNGVETPLIVNEHDDCPNTIIGGHRRFEGAKRAELNRVPVRWVSYPEPLATRRVVLNNTQREKTPGQKSEEAFVLEETARTAAKERMEWASDETPPANLQEGSQWDEDVAEAVGVSARTIRKGMDVKRMAYPDEYVHDDIRNPEKYDVSDDVREVARQEVAKMDAGETTFNGAYTAIKSAQDDSVETFTSQQTDEWSSPREVVEPIAESIGGFDLDPCSGAETSPFAAECYTEADDGLEQPWNGDVWVNPPYSGVESWVETAADEVRQGSAECVVFLCKGDSSTQWWQTALREAALVCAIEGRLSFGDGDNSAPFPSHIFVFGQGSALSDSLIDALDGLGALLVEQWSSRGES